MSSFDLDLAELAVRINNDSPLLRRMPTLFLFGQTRDNESSVLYRALREFTAGNSDSISFSRCLDPHDCEKTHGSPGFEPWTSFLVHCGIPRKMIIPADIPVVPKVHTRTEADALVQVAKRECWNEALIIASPFHLPRAFLSTVKAASEANDQIKIYAIPGTVLPWHQEVVHSQGTTKGTRIEILRGEFRRIKEYSENGSIAHPGQGLEYLDKRDR